MKTYSAGPGQEKSREVSCNLCFSRQAYPFISGDGFRFVRCLSCGLVYQNPAPVFDDLKSRYGENYFQYEIENEANFFNLMKLALKDINFERLGSRLPNGSGFLDIGCATGLLLDHIRKQGFKAQGVEICRESAEYGISKRGLDIFIGSLQEACFQECSFSIVHFSHLIEHVPDPREFLLEVHRILSPEGFAVITTPNIRGFQARLFKEKWRSAIADHLTLFSKKTLRQLLQKAGFKVLKVKTWGGLAVGTAPLWIKWPLDRLAKVFGFGDVMLYLAVKMQRMFL